MLLFFLEEIFKQRVARRGKWREGSKKEGGGKDSSGDSFISAGAFPLMLLPKRFFKPSSRPAILQQPSLLIPPLFIHFIFFIEEKETEGQEKQKERKKERERERKKEENKQTRK